MKRPHKAREHNQSALQDFRRIYEQNTTTLGLPQKYNGIFSHLSRQNTVSIVGIALGDEGKGRIVDNTIETLLEKKGVKHVYVIRFQGGNNAGHTVEKNGTKLALHLIPSFVFYEKAFGLMDRGMVVHVEDLRTEVSYVEDVVGSLTKRLFLSDDAILCTDLERAEEFLNTYIEEGSKGGTGRGIGPSYAHHYDKTGLRISDLLESDWQKKLEKRFLTYQKIFSTFDLTLSDIEVPDFQTTVQNKKASKRKVGSKQLFLKRLSDARNWLIKRNFVVNSFPLHIQVSSDPSIGIIFEGAQAAGLDVWTGTRPDVTSSNTTTYGIREGTGFWHVHDIDKRIGIIKLPYTSSVGARKMPTHINLSSTSPSPKINNAGSQNSPLLLGEGQGEVITNDQGQLTKDQTWALWIREAAHEYGTTTGRPRDITFLDLPFLRYNIRMSGVEMLIGTHLDTARDEDTIKVCTHYVNKNGQNIPYQPGLHYLTDVVPKYIELPSWDGARCQKAKTKRELPKKALQFLSFIQLQTQTPIIAATTGPDRKHIVYF